MNNLSRFVLVIGLVVNQWTLAMIFSEDSHIEGLHLKIIIWLFQITCVLLALFIHLLISERVNNKIKAILIGLSLPIWIVVLLEISLNLYNQSESNTVVVSKSYTINSDGTITDGGTILQDEILGKKPTSNIRFRDYNKTGDTIVYDYIATTDKYHRRMTPVSPGQNKEEFLIFFGGSFVWGAANDNETIPFYTSKCLNKFMTYNYGYGGYGTQQMLAKLQTNEIANEIDYKTGTAVYVFIPWHVYRVVGSMQQSTTFANYHPYYYLDEDDNLVRSGNFQEGRPYLNIAYRIIGKSRILKYFRINLPFISEEHIYLTYRIIRESHLEFSNQFKDSKFYVLFYPVNSKFIEGRNYIVQLKIYLDKQGIEYLDFTDLFDPSKNEYKIPDGHPSVYANKVIANNICAELKESSSRYH
ncbi:MAG TPA: hypothetical protein VLB82_00395 [Thermodesulfobacteriota bacterium]|nr:hypothetical protein [Thermodesulfobacteriota bacterium]